jgi:hypothetical protein
MSRRVTGMFHPSHHVPDLVTAELFYADVFGRPSRMMYDVFPVNTLGRKRGYPRDYCTFTPISDVLMDTIDPKRYKLDGEQLYATVEQPHLSSFGWYVEEISDLYSELTGRGIRCVDQYGNVALGQEAPVSASSDRVLFWSVPEDTGLRYEFFPADQALPGDLRPEPGWTIPPVSSDDPLGIERCSHHTILTDRPERALGLVVDVLGGHVIFEAENTLLETRSTYVSLADSVLEYAVPVREGSVAMAQMKGGATPDTYHSITWKVQDLEAVAAHLHTQGVETLVRTDSLIVVDPTTGLGVPWGFTTELVSEDPRGGA